MKFTNYMGLALEQAHIALALEEVPVGAVIIDNSVGRIICAHNEIVKNSDPTGHAEILAIKRMASLKKTSYLDTCDIFVTLEPCPMCAQAISFARIRRLYFGAYDIKGGGVENGPQIFNQKTCHHKPEVYGGIFENECSRLLKDFFSKKR